MNYEPTETYARSQDESDPLSYYRDQFYFPQIDGKNTIYLCGNSLGLQPKGVKTALDHELRHWKNFGVEGHFKGEMPWKDYHKFLQPQTAHIAGAKEEEVVVMNTLTTNLHLLMVSFYRPTRERFKIIMEAGAFPSDQYVVESQVKYHANLRGGHVFNPREAIVEAEPRKGEEYLRTEDIIATIDKHSEELALVLFGGVNYYSGQFFDVEAITKAGHQAGAYVGFDMAHAAGNLPLQLHDWNVDFAAWCSYKYLNSGPGGPSGIFVHERHGRNEDLPRFAGWWGHDENQRFQMRKGFIPMEGAAGWQLSNAQIFSFAAHKVSLDIFAEATMPALRNKSIMLTGYLEYLIDHLNEEESAEFRIITPRDPARRGCQLSILAGHHGVELFNFLTGKGAVVDWREPNVIRVAPVPLYNSFEDVYAFAGMLREFKTRH